MHLRLIDYRPPKIAQLLVAIAVLLHWLTPLRQTMIYSNSAIGIVLGVAGFASMIWGWWLFRQFDTPICPTARAERLITSGIYRITRNPMYLGMVAMLAALALAVGTLPFYLVAGIYFAVIDRAFCPYEEARLTQRFGDAYLSYKQRVRRWL
jgi:protein-S-isoprenylcysteine O-methyltransferase Ste14